MVNAVSDWFFEYVDFLTVFKSVEICRIVF
jgi:hypothetical protein